MSIEDPAAWRTNTCSWKCKVRRRLRWSRGPPSWLSQSSSPGRIGLPWGSPCSRAPCKPPLLSLPRWLSFPIGGETTLRIERFCSEILHAKGPHGD